MLYIKHYRYLLALICCYTCLTGHVNAEANNPQLYEGIVTSSGATATKEAADLRAALLQVLGKLTGNYAVINQPATLAKIGKINQYIQQHSRQHIDNEIKLVARFDTKAVENLIKNLGLQVWRNRPTVLVWVVVQTGENAVAVNIETHAEAAKLINFHATQQVLPIFLPLLDLEDLKLLPTTEVKTATSDKLNGILQRYGVDVLLLGEMQLTQGDKWEAQWWLTHSGQTIKWVSPMDSLSNAVQAGIQKTVSTLAQAALNPPPPPTTATTSTAASTENPAVATVQEKSFTLQINNVLNFDDFSAVNQYLGQINRVTFLQVSQVQAQSVIFTLKLQDNDVQSFLKDFLLNQKFKPDPTANNEWIYRFNP